jgi:hypothetical protein
VPRLDRYRELTPLRAEDLGVRLDLVLVERAYAAEAAAR